MQIHKYIYIYMYIYISIYLPMFTKYTPLIWAQKPLPWYLPCVPETSVLGMDTEAFAMVPSYVPNTSILGLGCKLQSSQKGLRIYQRPMYEGFASLRLMQSHGRKEPDKVGHGAGASSNASIVVVPYP